MREPMQTVVDRRHVVNGQIQMSERITRVAVATELGDQHVRIEPTHQRFNDRVEYFKPHRPDRLGQHRQVGNTAERFAFTDVFDAAGSGKQILARLV